MSRSKLDALLHQTHLLRGVEAEELRALPAALERERYMQGQTIVRQGSPVRGLYLLLEGKVREERVDARGAVEIKGELAPGDLLGDVELVRDEPWRATYRAQEPVTLYRWPGEHLSQFMDNHPDALRSLRFTADSHHLASKLRFNWLTDGERIYGLARKHLLTLLRSLIPVALLLASAISLGAWALSSSQGWLGWVAAGLGMLAAAWGSWKWIDWTNDYYILTDRRAVWLEKVVALYDNRREAPLHWVLSVAVNTDVLGRLLGYGDVVVRTYTGKLVFRHVSNPRSMAALVEEHWRRLRSQRQEVDREAILEQLQQRLSEGTERGEGAQDPLESILEESEPAPARPSERVGLGHWTLEMRFEQDGVITYRKHWAVLLRQILAPTLLLLFALALLGAGLVGLFEALSPQRGAALSAPLLLPALLWWLYRYVDWANDLYQITPTQIVDVHKKPLASERRKVAPLENILGTEVDRRGLTGLILNYGAVITNVGTAEFVFDGVFDPAGVQQDIVRAQDAFLERQRQTQREERRDEVVEWLSAYHEEIADKPEGHKGSGHIDDGS